MQKQWKHIETSDLNSRFEHGPRKSWGVSWMFRWESPGVIIDASLFVPIHLFSDEVWPILALKISRPANSKQYPIQRGDAFNYQQKGGNNVQIWCCETAFWLVPWIWCIFTTVPCHAGNVWWPAWEPSRWDSLCFHRTFSPISDGARAAMEGGVQSRFCSRFGVEIHCGPDTGTVQHRHHRLS